MSSADRAARRKLEKQIATGVQDLTKQRENECLPIARYLFGEFAKRADTLLMGVVDDNAVNDYYNKFFAEALAGYLVDRNIKVTDIEYIFQVMNQAIEFLKNKATNTLSVRVDDANAKRWGIKDIDQLRLKHITYTLSDQELPQDVDKYVPENKK